ncbi:diguanylate cyclase domain-containing protein [Aeromonas aquatica]|uniref:diguanylate cyclase domain-containing protein n=1 Tax=Aeromonas aquatica TaxID=558964 RepID=UPI00286F368F|nr:diguanylate cyclase [Aeromonas aquatica]
MPRLLHAFAKYRLQWLLLGLSILLLFLALQHSFGQITELNKRDTIGTAAELRAQYQQIDTLLEAMRGQAEERLRSNPQTTLTHQLYRALHADPVLGIALDRVPANLPPGLVGNLTGPGPLPAPGSEREARFHLALSLSPLLSTAAQLLSKDVAWLYFTGVDHFIYLYPWVPSRQFRFDTTIYQKSYWLDALAQPSDNRHATLSRPYQDFAGRGQMITLSQPITHARKVVGVLSIDILLSHLEQALQKPGPQTGTLFLVNAHQQILARSQPGTAPPLIRGEQQDEYHWQQGAFQFVHAIPDTPLTLIHRVPLLSLLQALFWQSVTALLTLFCLAVATLSSLRSRRLNRRLNYLSQHDALTGAFNRHHFDAFEHRHAKAGSHHIGAIMFDCDHFKLVNDRFGHGVGDQVLIQLVQLCQPLQVRGNSLIRWGGEEFLLLVVGKTIPLDQLAEQMRVSIEQHPWSGIAADLRVTVSLGYCRQYPGIRLQEAIRRADAALYRAKANGRNRSEGWQDDAGGNQE